MSPTPAQGLHCTWETIRNSVREDKGRCGEIVTERLSTLELVQTIWGLMETVVNLHLDRTLKARLACIEMRHGFWILRIERDFSQKRDGGTNIPVESSHKEPFITRTGTGNAGDKRGGLEDGNSLGNSCRHDQLSNPEQTIWPVCTDMRQHRNKFAKNVQLYVVEREMKYSYSKTSKFCVKIFFELIFFLSGYV